MLACAAPVGLRAQTSAIDGVVSDTALAPLVDATVTIVGTAIRVVTGTNGRFRLSPVPSGEHMLLVRRIGFEATTARISVAEHDTLRLSFALLPAVATLDTVAVAARSLSPRLAEFYERRKIGPGQFLTQDQIEKVNAVQASDLFRRFNGIAIAPDGRHGQSPRMPVRFSPGKQMGCPIMAIIDGVAKEFDYGRLPTPRDIAAVEFYAGPSEIPLQYKGTDDGMWCGLLLIWTRDGSK